MKIEELKAKLARLQKSKDKAAEHQLWATYRWYADQISIVLGQIEALEAEAEKTAQN